MMKLVYIIMKHIIQNLNTQNYHTVLFAQFVFELAVGLFLQFKFMDNDSKDRQQKQTYLRTEILEKNYDPEQFILFLNQKLQIGDNLDLCTLQQLKNVVLQFVNNKNIEQEKQETQKIIKQKQDAEKKQAQLYPGIQSVIKEKESTQPTKKKKTILSFTKHNPVLNEFEYQKIYKCGTLHNKYSQIKDIKCQVTNPERKTMGGFFGIGATSFLEFRVTTQALKYSVGRRYSDFQWLRGYLIKVYPSYIIPPIPEKKASKRTVRHVEKRMRILEYFLNDLLSYPEFINNKFVEGFLSITDPKKFQNLKKQSQKMKPFESISSSQTEQGTVRAKLSEQNKVFLQELEKFTPKVQKTYKQITRTSKQLQTLLIQQVNAMYQIGNHFGALHEDIRQIMNRIPLTTGLGKMNQIYITLNNMMIEWGNIQRNQHQFLQKNFNTFFKYVRNELSGFMEVINKQQEIENQFAKMKLALQKKKEKIYAFNDVSKWQLKQADMANVPKQAVYDKSQAFSLMLPRETAQLQAYRSKLFFYIDQFHVNGNKNHERCAVKFCQNFKQFAIKIKVNNQQLGEMWMQMSQNFSNPNIKSKSLKEVPIIKNVGDDIVDD